MSRTWKEILTGVAIFLGVATVVGMFVWAGAADLKERDARCRLILAATTDTIAVVAADQNCTRVLREADR